ncbi:potassium channel family protein [Natronomonas sp. EA1]|uniref:potassium channel family protein n=1 Tax=Natronomonas sp. EA1 TaxID=3421655 RepID=UPI003EBDEB55
MLGGRLLAGSKQRRRVVLYLIGLTVLVFAYTFLYQFVIAVFEGETVSFAKALLTVTESFTTVGFGEDSGLWSTTPVYLFLVVVQLTGVSLVFLAFPVFLAPYLQERISTTPPTAVDGIADHVILAGFTSRGKALVEELDARDRPYVVIEPSRERVVELREDDIEAIHGEPEQTETLHDANIGSARALVADVDDETNASIALAANDVEGTNVITFVDDPDVAQYHRYAGANETYLPQQLIAEAIARKITAGVTPELGDAVEISESFDIVELPVQAGSVLAGTTIEDSGIRERTGTNVIGAWFRGEFVSPPPTTERIDEQTILVAAGREDQLERLKELTLSEQRRQRTGPVVVAGYGEVGHTVTTALREASREVRVVDREPMDGVDVVGDITEESVLREAGVAEASTVVLAVADDSTAIFAALVCRELNPEVEVIGRADATESVRKLYRAGADYVLAIATVSGRLLASTVFDEDVISFDKGVEVVRMQCGDLAGKTLAGADLRARTGCTVIAVERDGDVVTEVGPGFRIQHGDELVIAGTDEDVNRVATLT